ncbi:MAG: OmpA family protein [Muribaculaceae bacterium]|nr:OmpA family protein [Muribaculaceae bacterium]
MKTEIDYNNRLPGHPEPLELPSHTEESAESPAMKKPETVYTSDAQEVRGLGGFGWAFLAAAAIAVFVGAIYFFSDRAHNDYPDIAAAKTTTLTTPAKGFAAKMVTVKKTDPSATSGTAGATEVAEVTEDVVYLFPLNGSDIKNNPDLDKLARQVSANDNAYVIVTAYTDESGRPEYNQRLSEKRAKKVGAYLVAHGVPSSHVSTKGMGPTHKYPTVEQNRRAVVHVDY